MADSEKANMATSGSQSEPAQIQPEKSAPISDHNSSAFSLGFLFQMVTCCALFFAVYRFSPFIAIVSTLIISPAIMRTVMIGDRIRKLGREYTLKDQGTFFFGSIGVVLMTIGLAGTVFLAISLAFGVAGMLFTWMIDSSAVLGDAAVVGTAGGMIWGFAGGMLAIGYAVLKLWMPDDMFEPNTGQSSNFKTTP